MKKSCALMEYFQVLPDPRKITHSHLQHALEDIIVISVLATICGADTWTEIEEFGREHEQWLKQFLSLNHSIPSHDTFGRVFAFLDHTAFEQCFVAWVKSMHTLSRGTIVSLDGKTNRRAHAKGGRPLHIVNAYAGALKLALGQRTVDGKTNEITAIPELLDMLMLKGCIVTTDAMGCQGWVTQTIRKHGADYVLAVKKNQGHLYADVQNTFRDTIVRFDSAEKSERGHGRTEYRVCHTTGNLSCVRNPEKWTDLQSLSVVTSTRTIDGKTSTMTRYFVSSLPPDAEKILTAVRAHWEVENGLHWLLDVSFKEDASRVRTGHAAKNLALVRKIALNLIRRETKTKGSVRLKRLRAGWNMEYLLDIVGVTL